MYYAKARAGYGFMNLKMRPSARLHLRKCVRNISPLDFSNFDGHERIRLELKNSPGGPPTLQI